MKFIDIWALLKFSTYHPIPFTSLKVPGILTGEPSSFLTTSPSNKFFDIGFGILLLLPASLNSKAISVAIRASLEFKFILYAIRKSLHPITVAPAFLCTSFGPKSGIQSGSFNLSTSPSYSPFRISGSFLLLALEADFS